MIDGYPVNLNDSVYVLREGIGSVTKITRDGGFYVTTSVGGESYYQTGGYVGNQRRVYWHNPIFIIPPKNRRFWKAFTAIANILFDKLETIHEFGELTNEETNDVE